MELQIFAGSFRFKFYRSSVLMVYIIVGGLNFNVFLQLNAAGNLLDRIPCYGRLGQVENARRHLCFPGLKPDPAELHKLQAVEKHLKKCTDSRRVGDWKSVLRECDATIASGADFSPQVNINL